MKSFCNIGHQYPDLTNQTENRDFFGLADCVKRLESLVPTKTHIEALEKQVEQKKCMTQKLKEYKECEDKALIDMRIHSEVDEEFFNSKIPY